MERNPITVNIARKGRRKVESAWVKFDVHATILWTVASCRENGIVKLIILFMYRRPILCTLYGAVDFLNVLKKYIMYP